MTYEEIKADKLPHLMVKFARGADGNENFEWGVMNNIPVLNMIGALTALQIDLARGEYVAECEDEVMVLITWNLKERELNTYKHRDIPHGSLLGFLEIVKTLLVTSKLVKSSAEKNMLLLGPDGRPMRR